MVDFQSRDTDRGYGDDEDDEDEPDDAADATDDEATEQSGQTDASSEETRKDEDSEDTQNGDSDPGDTTANGATSSKSDGREHGHSDDHDHREPGGHDHAHEHSGGHDHGETGGHDHGETSGHAHAHGADVELLGVAVVTVSSTRTQKDDLSGDVIQALIEAADHEVVTREIIRDDLDGIQTTLLNLTGRDDVDVVVTTGGTGVTPDDVTVEGARPLFDRELPGFGELFRILSYEEIGTRAMVSRATAGMVDGVPVFCLPGSEAAARLGTEELVVEEMAHLVSLARRDD